MRTRKRVHISTMSLISLRKAQEKDLQFYFEFRNEPSVRATAFSTEPIELPTHSSWFYRKLRDPNTYLFVIEIEGKAVGQVRIDLEGTEGEIHIAVVPEHRGKGYAPLAICQASEQALKENLQVVSIVAHIKTDNTASQKSFAKAGFIDKELVIYKGHQCIKMVLPKL